VEGSVVIFKYEALNRMWGAYGSNDDDKEVARKHV
jgi:hypothetical protein